MTETLAKVMEFHESYSCVIKHKPDISDQAVNDFRVRFLQEELDELKAALAEGNLVEVLDALTDLQYVLDGTYISFGLHAHKRAAFDEVHRSNMSKLGADGKPILRESDGKVLKGENYAPPNLVQFLNGVLQDKAA